MHTMVIPNVKKERLEFYKDWAQQLGGTVTSVAKEDDGEFTVIVLIPEK